MVFTVVVGLWAGWAAGLVALLVARHQTLTAMRLLVTAGLVAMVAAVAVGTRTSVADAVAVALAAGAVVGAFAPWVGEAWVDGSSYGPEQRHALRPPALLSYLIVPLTGSLVMAGAVAGPLLLAARQWIPGAVMLLIGWPIAAAGVRSLHQLARRWVVLVPAGLVIHDPFTMPEAQLVLRRMVSNFGPAPIDSEADDLTAGAPGLALQLDLHEPVDLLLRSGSRSTETRSSTSLLITPSRPRRLLDGARERRIPVG